MEIVFLVLALLQFIPNEPICYVDRETVEGYTVSIPKECKDIMIKVDKNGK